MSGGLINSSCLFKCIKQGQCPAALALLLLSLWWPPRWARSKQSWAQKAECRIIPRTCSQRPTRPTLGQWYCYANGKPGPPLEEMLGSRPVPRISHNGHRSQEHQELGKSARHPIGRVLVRDTLSADRGMRLMLIHSPNVLKQPIIPSQSLQPPPCTHPQGPTVATQPKMANCSTPSSLPLLSKS